jgi:hypothetical protein
MQTRDVKGIVRSGQGELPGDEAPPMPVLLICQNRGELMKHKGRHWKQIKAGANKK